MLIFSLAPSSSGFKPLPELVQILVTSSLKVVFLAQLVGVMKSVIYRKEIYKRGMDSERSIGTTTVIAGCDIAANTWSPSGVGSLNLRKLLIPFSPKHVCRILVKDGLLHLCEDYLLYNWANLFRLSRDCTEQNLELTRSRDGAVCLRTICEVSTGMELFAWYGSDLLSELEIPFLTPTNIRGKSYSCHQCNITYLHPNPLKAHLVLECQAKCNHLKYIPDVQANQQTPILHSQTVTVPNLAMNNYYFGRQGNVSIRSLAESGISVAGPSDTKKSGHICVYCGKIYSRRYGLKIHVRTHTGYKPLKCQVCLRPFSDPSNLNKHVRLHGDADTPYRCHYCGKVLVRRRDLQRHLKSRHAVPNESLPSGNESKN